MSWFTDIFAKESDIKRFEDSVGEMAGKAVGSAIDAAVSRQARLAEMSSAVLGGIKVKVEMAPVEVRVVVSLDLPK